MKQDEFFIIESLLQKNPLFLKKYTLHMEDFLDDEELEGSGFQFQNIEEAIIDEYRVKDIKASSYIE